MVFGITFFILVIALFLYMSLIEVNWIKIKKHKVINKNFELSKRLRIVQISDMHGKYKFFGKRLSDIVNPLEPDFIFITGDILDKFSGLNDAINNIKCLKASKAIIFVKGNHENYESGFLKKKIDIDCAAILDKLKKAGIKVLVNAHYDFTWCGKKVAIYGLDNSEFEKTSYNIDINFSEYDYSIILAHDPRSYEVLKRRNIMPDMYLAGHTHGGQINIPFLFKIAEGLSEHKGFEAGLFIDKTGNIFNISSGLGNTNISMRFLDRPEINVFDL